MGTRVREWLSVSAVILFHVGLYGFFWLAIDDRLGPDQMFWYFLAVPYANAGLLGTWLTAGQSKAWFRFMVTLVGVSALMAIGVSLLPVHALVLAPSLVATTGGAAMMTLGLGCLGSLFPTAARWQLRFGLWEIVVSICLIGVSMAILRLVGETSWISFSLWYTEAGGHFLVFGLLSGVFVAACAVPLLLIGKWFRRISAAGVLLLFAVLPLIAAGLFELLGLSGGDLDLFYPAYAGQLCVAWISLFLLEFGIGGIFRTSKSAPDDATSEESPPSEPEADFLHMQ